MLVFVIKKLVKLLRFKGGSHWLMICPRETGDRRSLGIVSSMYVKLSLEFCCVKMLSNRGSEVALQNKTRHFLLQLL